MARREIFVDDIDGKESDDVETRRFSIGRTSYTIDLSAKNYEAFLKDVEKYTSVAATETNAPTAPRSVRAARGTSAPKAPSQAAEIRAWAASEGIQVSERGRIHKDVIEKYEYAMGKDKA